MRSTAPRSPRPSRSERARSRYRFAEVVSTLRTSASASDRWRVRNSPSTSWYSRTTCSTASSAFFVASRASRNRPPWIAARARLRCSIAGEMSAPTFLAVTNFARDALIVCTTRSNCAFWRTWYPFLAIPVASSRRPSFIARSNDLNSSRAPDTSAPLPPPPAAGPDRPLRILDPPVALRLQSPPNGLQALLREREGRLEVVRLDGGPGTGQQVLGRRRVLAQVSGGDDERLRGGKGRGKLLVDDLLALLPCALRVVDGLRVGLLRERVLRPLQGGHALPVLGPHGLRDVQQGSRAVDEMAGTPPVRALAALLRLRRLFERALVVLPGRERRRLRERGLRFRDVRVDTPGAVDPRFRGADLLFRLLPDLGRFLDFFLKLLAKGNIPQESAAHFSGSAGPAGRLGRQAAWSPLRLRAFFINVIGCLRRRRAGGGR